MAQQAYTLGQSQRALQPVSIPAFSPLTGEVTLLTVPDGALLRLMALGINYHLDVAQETLRTIFLEIRDPDGVVMVGADAATSISTENIAPTIDTEVSFGNGFFGAQSGAGDNQFFQAITLGILDIILPATYAYTLKQLGFAGNDTVTSTSCLVELIDPETVDSSLSALSQGFGAVPWLLNTP